MRERGWSHRKRKTREKLFGGRGICENVKETWRKAAEEKRFFRGKNSNTQLGITSWVQKISAWIASGPEWLSYERRECSPVLSFWKPTTFVGFPQVSAALYRVESSQEVLRLWFQHRDPVMFFQWKHIKATQKSLEHDTCINLFIQRKDITCR